MTHWERVEAALAGRATDSLPISLWRHWPVDDQDPARLAEVMVRWQQAWDFDLVKFMPTGTYSIEDWGAQTTYVPTPHGTRTVTRLGVRQARDWPKLPALDVRSGCLGMQNRALALAAAELRGAAPILQTIFSPLTTARKLAGDAVFSHMRTSPDLFEAGLEAIARITIAFARESLAAGADGFFFATQCATTQLMNEPEYARFGERYDRMVLDALRGAARLLLLHAHGEDIMFDRLAAYPVDMLSWHDRRTTPVLREGAGRFQGVAVCGLDEHGTLMRGVADEIRAEVDDAACQTRGRRILLAPGCVCPIAIPDASIRAVMAAARGFHDQPVPRV